MAVSNKKLENPVDSTNIVVTKKIADLKKKLLLAEGQKRAHAEEWEQREKKINDTIVALKKDVKELTARLLMSSSGPRTKEKELLRQSPEINFPSGARTAEEAVKIYDLKIIDLTKESDRLCARYRKRKEHFDRLHQQYVELLAVQGDKAEENDSLKTKFGTKSPAQTIEEDICRKRIVQLENEIHRKNVQWTEADHIRKKYKAIRASLLGDAERFEKNLLELETALNEQQAEINRMNEVHSEALQMRDAMKIVLMRQEHSAHSTAKMRERQAIDFRRQVEERKSELERLERKLFTSSKTVVHHGSTESLLGDQMADKTTERPSAHLSSSDDVQKLETQLKLLMIATGATSPEEVLQRFTAQKEATSRLNYLRTVTEAEKKHLESHRDQLMSELESSKFTDVKESEVNQELLEKLKNGIAEQVKREQDNARAADHSKNVLDSIRSTIIDLILKLQEIDESLDPENTFRHLEKLTDQMLESTTNERLLQSLEDKLRRGLMATGQLVMREDDSGRETDDYEAIESVETANSRAIDNDDPLDLTLKLDELHVPSSTNFSSRPQSAVSESNRSQIVAHEKERPAPFPSCYANLLAGRATGVSTSISPGQTIQPVATDDEAEVPSRSYLKRQALIIVDSKSRRKGYRQPTKRK